MRQKWLVLHSFNLSSFNLFRFALFSFALFTGLAAADENLYEKNYQAQANAGLQSSQANPETKMYVSNHKDEDNISMLENGYDMMGSSNFEAGNVPADLALQHGKKIKADTVLVYTKYASKLSGVSKLEMIKEAAKTTGEVDASVLKDNGEQYKYFASYWVKLPTPLLGVHIVKLVRAKTAADSDVQNREVAGLKILAVIKGSPAEKAGLQKADTIQKIGDLAVNKPEELIAAVRQYQGKAVDIIYARDGESAKTQAALNNSR